MELFDGIIKEVKSMLPHGYDVAIVGGAVRDTLLGLKFKDIDVSILCDGDEEQDIVGNVVNLMNNLGEFNSVHGFSGTYSGLSEAEELTSDFTQRLHGCLKINLKGYEVDLLFQRDVDNFKNVVEGYDHVANMFIYHNGEFKLGTSKGYASDLINKGEGFNNERVIRECRLQKMGNLYKDNKQALMRYIEEVKEYD